MNNGTDSQERYARSRALFARAVRVIPGGIYGHTSPVAAVPVEFPYYAERAEGCRYQDVDGNTYLDFMCGYGPIILGYHHPAVDAAAAAQRARGMVFNHPTEVMVELAEDLVERIDFADWAVFAKNGSDVTTWAIQVARQHTGRRKVLKVAGSYHGVDSWCTPGYGGIIEEDRVHIHSFPWNDLEAFRARVREFAGDIAAVILTPYHHPSFADSELAGDGFHAAIRKICDREGIVLVLDDIRTGFRLHSGGSHRRFGIEPDLACYCKALGNGYPISAAVGRGAFAGAASQVFLTGSYWNNGEAIAAARVCLQVIERERVPERLEELGERLASGLVAAGARHGIGVRITGPRAAPYFGIEGDHDLRRVQEFCVRAVREGAYFHPHHNWFLSAAHTEAAIDEAVAIADRCFRTLCGVVRQKGAVAS